MYNLYWERRNLFCIASEIVELMRVLCVCIAWGFFLKIGTKILCPCWWCGGGSSICNYYRTSLWRGRQRTEKVCKRKYNSLYSLSFPPPPSLPLWLISGGLFHHTTYVYVYTLLTDITVCLLLLSHSDYNHFRFDDNLKRTRVFGLYKGMAVGTSVGMVYFLIFLIYSVSFW